MKNAGTETERNRALLVGCVDRILSEISNGNNIELRQAPDGSIKVLVVRKKNLLAAAE